MTHIIEVAGVNDALMEGVWHLRTSATQEQSRNGPVLVANEPVITQYNDPQQRVLFEPRRDANPVFHLMEALWMMAGEDDVTWLLQFNSSFGKYAEDNGVMHGAYGWRWRGHFGVDQIEGCLHKLKDSTTRQAVIAMWSPTHDLNTNVRDRPCNTHIYFDRRHGALNMWVSCRSNDMLWGAYGSNVVHFSILQELMAHALGVPVGVYYQASFNFHMYTDLPMARELLRNPPNVHDYNEYYLNSVPIIPLLGEGETLADFLGDCKTFVNGDPAPLKTHFVNIVAGPLSAAYLKRRAGESYGFILAGIPHCDWKVAFQQWCYRRDTA